MAKPGRLLVSVLAVAALAAPWPARAARTTRSEARPNILVIVTDDQPLKTMGVMPQTRAWLGRNGTRFTSAFATTPSCCPSRASIFTGLYAHNHRVLNNHRALDLDTSTTVQHKLREHGYRTALFGKYLNSWPVEEPPPDFDSWAVFPNSSSGYRGGQWNVQGEVREIDQYGTGVLAKEAAGFLWDARTDRAPWLMFVSTAAPHAPFYPQPYYSEAVMPAWQPDPSVFEHSEGVDPTLLADKPSYLQRRGVAFEHVSQLREDQLRSLLSVDDLVGRLHRILSQTDQLDNTLVVYLSDNGYLWGQHGRMWKFVPYDPSVRVPMYVSWPGHVSAGRTDDRLVATIDVAPTILDAAGVEGTDLDGDSVLKRGWTRDRLLLEYWGIQNHRVPSWASLVTSDRQYIEYYGEDGSVSFKELYDREQDPYQLANLLAPVTAERLPELVAGQDLSVDGLSEQLGADRSCRGVTCP